MADTLKEYLIQLGFKVDENGWKGFNEKVARSSENVLKLGATTVAVATQIGVAVEKVARTYEELYYVSQRTGGTITGLKAQEFGFRQIGSTAEAARGSVEGFAAAIRQNPGIRGMFEGMGIDTSDSQKAIGQLVDKLKGQFGEGGYFIAQRYAAMGGLDEQTFRQIWMNREKLRGQEEASAARQRAAGIDTEKFARDSVRYGDTLRVTQDKWGLLIDRVVMGWLPAAQKTVELGGEIADVFTRVDKATGGWAGTAASLALALGSVKVALVPIMAILRALGLVSAAGAAGGASLGLGGLAMRFLGPVGAFAAGLGLGGQANAGETPLRGGAHPSDMSAGGNRASMMSFYQSKGWTSEQSAGIVANIQKESNFNPRAVGDGGKAYGLAQWHPDRQANFARWAGKSIRDASLQEQMDFIHYEMTQGTEQLAGRALKGTKTARDAGSVVSRMYERPADVFGAASARGSLAETILSSGAGSAANVSINHKTENHISGVSDPKKAAVLVDDAQKRTNGDIVRNTKSAFN